MSRQQYVIIDYETYSEADLKKVGAWEYSVHPSTEILCAAWRVGTRESLKSSQVQTWCPRFDKNKKDMKAFFDAILTPGAIIVAHNALFEQVITHNVLLEYSLPPERWLCTASLAAAHALPRNLERAAIVMGLPVKKDMDGRRLILKWCKPRRPTKHDPSLRHTDTEELKRIVEYCKTDVIVETELFLKMPPLSPTERRIWVLDQKINLRGINVDRELISTALDLIAEESAFVKRRVAEITSGEVATTKQVKAVLSWLEREGVFIPNLQKKTVDDTLSEGLATGSAKELLEIRQSDSKSSTAKYQAFELRSRYDGRLRDTLLYHGASTGRWAAGGVQPHNFPKGTIKDPYQAVDILKTGDLELVRMIYGSPMEALSSCLRSVLIASPGTVLDVADYNAIEARVLFWIADHLEGIKAFRMGRDLYREMASNIFDIPVKEIQKESFHRFVGKTAVLGAGFGLGWQKFQMMCAGMGQKVSDELAETAIKAYRETHQPVAILWKNIERAAMAAVENVGKTYGINHTKWFVRGEFLYCELPSGRRLAYHKPSVKWEPSPWNTAQDIKVLRHWSEDLKTRQWVDGKTYGGKLVENVVQATARDLMAEAMLRVEAHGAWKIILTVHDELVAERDEKANVTNEDFCKLMAKLPPWATGCPVTAEGWSGPRYKK